MSCSNASLNNRKKQISTNNNKLEALPKRNYHICNWNTALLWNWLFLWNLHTKTEKLQHRHWVTYHCLMISWLLMMLCLFIITFFLNPLHVSLSREANIHIFKTVNSIISDIIRSNYDPTLTCLHSRQGAVTLWHEKEANPLDRYCAGGRWPGFQQSLMYCTG